MVIVYAAIPALLFLAGIATYLFVQCAKFRRAEKQRLESLEKSGVLVEVAPGCRESVKEVVERCVEVRKELMELTYYCCDNFQKYQERISGKMEELYNNGGLQNLCADIVYLANLAENGALYRMAAEYRLTDLELRTCCFIHMGFKWQQICTADTLTGNAYNVRCSRIRKKFSLAKEERIPDFIEEYCKRSISSSSEQ